MLNINHNDYTFDHDPDQNEKGDKGKKNYKTEKEIKRLRNQVVQPYIVNSVNKLDLPFDMSLMVNAISSSPLTTKNYNINLNNHLVGAKVTHEAAIVDTGSTVCLFLDNGSGVNLVHSRIVKQFNLKIYKHNHNITLTGFGGVPTYPDLIAEVPIMIGTETVNVLAFVSESPLLSRYDLIIGTPILGQQIGLLMERGGNNSLLVYSKDRAGATKVSCKSCIAKFPELEKQDQPVKETSHTAIIDSVMETCSCTTKASKLAPLATENDSCGCSSSSGPKPVRVEGEIVGSTLSKLSNVGAPERAPSILTDFEKLDVPLSKIKSKKAKLDYTPKEGTVRATRMGRKARREAQEFSIALIHHNLAVNLKPNNKSKQRRIKRKNKSNERKLRLQRKEQRDAAVESATKYKAIKFSHAELTKIDAIVAAIEIHADLNNGSLKFNVFDEIIFHPSILRNRNQQSRAASL